MIFCPPSYQNYNFGLITFKCSKKLIRKWFPSEIFQNPLHFGLKDFIYKKNSFQKNFYSLNSIGKKIILGNCSYHSSNTQLLLLLSRFSRVRLCATPETAATRLPHPCDSPGKNTGAGCHFLLQCIKVKSESEVAQSCPTRSDPMDCSPPGSSIIQGQKAALGFVH